MKKLLIATFAASALLFTLPGILSAQTSVRFGVKAGASMNFSKITSGNLSVSGDSRFGFYGGGLMEVSPNSADNKFKLQLEALYSRVNMQYSSAEDGGETAKINVNQINVPVLAKYFIIPELSVNLGPTLNYNLGGHGAYEDASGNTIEDDLTDYNKFQIGLAAGATYYICEGFFIDARYTPIFGTLNKNIDGMDGAGIKMSAIKLGIGYKF